MRTRKLGLLLVCLLFGTSAWAQSITRQSVVLSASGRPVPGAKIYVCTGAVTVNFQVTPPCSPAQTIYSDYATTQPITQPLVSDGLGNYLYYLPTSATTVTEVITGTGINSSSTVLTFAAGGGASNLSQLSGGTAPAGQSYDFSPSTSLTLPLAGNGAVKPAASDAVQYASVNGSDSLDGFSWGSAKASPSAAVTAACNGTINGIVFLSAGSVFTLSSQLVLPDQCILEMNGAQLKAGVSFPSNTPLVKLGTTTAVFNTLIRNGTLNCNSVTGCSGLFSNQVNENSGWQNIEVDNAMSGCVEVDATSQNWIPGNLNCVMAATAPGTAIPILIKAASGAMLAGTTAGHWTVTGTNTNTLAANIELFNVGAMVFSGIHTEAKATDGILLTGTSGTGSNENVFLGVTGNAVLTNTIHVDSTSGNGNNLFFGVAKNGATVALKDDVTGVSLSSGFAAYMESPQANQLALTSSGGGTITHVAPSTASNFTLTDPAATGNLPYFTGSWTNGNCLQAGASAGLISPGTVPCLGTGYSFPAQVDGFTATFNHTFTANRAFTWPDGTGTVCVSGLSIAGCAAGTGPAGSAFAIQYQSSPTGAFTGLASPAGPGIFEPTFQPTTATPVAPIVAQQGLASRAITGLASTDTALYTDIFNIVQHDIAGSAGVTETLPLPSSLNNTAFASMYCNFSAQMDSVSPSTFTIQIGSNAAGSSANINPGQCLKYWVDPNNANTWDATESVPLNASGLVPPSSLASTGVTAGSYTNANITVNAQGQVTSAANGTGGGGGSSVAQGGITSSASMGAGTTWLPVFGRLAAAGSAEAKAQAVAPYAFTISHLNVLSNVAWTSTNTMQVTLFMCAPTAGACTGAAQTLTCTLASGTNGGLACSDTTHSVSVPAGDYVDYQIVVTGTGPAGNFFSITAQVQ